MCPWALGAAVLEYPSLFPGTVLLSGLLGVADEGMVYELSAFSFAALILAVAAARAQDRVRAAPARRVGGT